MAEAQSYFNREGVADEIEVFVTDPGRVDNWTLPLIQAAGEGAQVWNWRDSSGSFLAALDMEDDVMFVILSVLVLIASMNITSGLIMLVKNKGRDIGILRTMGLTEGSVLRVFFLCGAFTGIIGTIHLALQRLSLCRLGTLDMGKILSIKAIALPSNEFAWENSLSYSQYNEIIGSPNV